ncbi:MAG TPA: 3-isopropylmalate dehydratase small subunit [Methylomirabilota bacterium]|nr:3-isopropylmalate dehydratase small subunit [Methylomirabilota bacterium]
MEPFTRLTAVAVPMDLPNIDTDRVIPARFLRKPREAGFGPLLFHDVRFDAAGAPQPDFVLNHPAYRDAKILVTAENFGCGSSREMAVWALMDYGIRVVIGPSFGDIFIENCFKNGALAVVLPSDVVAGLRRALARRPGATLTVDLESQSITAPAGEAIRFEIDAFRKHGLLTGQDEVEMTLARLPAIEAFEARRRVEMPWLG